MTSQAELAMGPAAGIPGALGLLRGLSGPLGAIGPARRISADGWLPSEYDLYSAPTGNLSAVIGPYEAGARTAHGAGRACRDPQRAELLALSEAAERYAGLTVDRRLVTTDTAAALGATALDLDCVPRCSASELRRPGCPVRPADHEQPIRWMAGTDLLSGREVLLPAVMVYLQPPQLPGERFWLPISTGCAGHFSPAEAVLNAVLEVIERDAIALTWLQRRPLPRLAEECLPSPGRWLAAWCQRRGISTYLFDATTDVGIPVVYCLQTAEHPPSGGQLVGCACGFDVGAAATHAIMEAMATRLAVQSHRPPKSYAAFQSIADGAATMAAQSRRPAFGFLLADLAARPVSWPCLPGEATASASASAAGRLRLVLGRLAELGMAAFAADISTCELASIGYTAVRVIIPQLQPMSGRPLAQYRGHPRVLTAPGPRALRARELNPYPQPMA